MRNPPNETLKDQPSTLAQAGKESSENTRRCILSGEKDVRAGLIRLAVGPDGVVAPDVRARAPGRGAWIGVDKPTLDEAIAKGKLKGALARAFKTGDVTAPADLSTRIGDALRQDALNRLGLESRSGTLLTGSEKIDAAARKGEVKMLMHANDAGIDGNRKLDQAWRVGRDSEGSGAQGMVLPVGRTILSLALGRENVVHIAIIDRGAADRVSLAIARWQDFMGSVADAEPCANGAQGSSAHQAHSLNIEDEGFESSR
ncbi:DUF448 domain-containing protein [Sphingobium boeckii]|uniref:YlxR domain-containing protein n=1 Tax=Sphingobium boeckii TaxID=1082345 RepID=A0A7W9ECW0_9SPHN|nr:hypothetical protein [Sphingobium boeckii]